LLALFLLAPAKREIAAQLKRVWSVLVLGATPFLLYAPVHAEDRYLAPFFVLLWVALFVGALGGAEGMDDRTPLVICGTAALLMLAGAVAAVGSSGANGAPRTQYEIAHSLESQGLKKGDEVAIVRGDPPYYWARLAGARITMEISFAGPTCPGCLRLETQWEIAQRILSSHGAVLLVAPALAGIVDQPGWKPLGNTGVFAYRF
jgi:hypothetical protein